MYFLGRQAVAGRTLAPAKGLRGIDEVAFLARAPVATLPAFRAAAWRRTLEFWTTDGWKGLRGGARPGDLDLVQLFDDAPPETSLEFSDVLGAWFVLNIPFGDRALQIRVSDGAELPGTWSEPLAIYEIPEPWCCGDTFSYSFENRVGNRLGAATPRGGASVAAARRTDAAARRFDAAVRRRGSPRSQAQVPPRAPDERRGPRGVVPRRRRNLRLAETRPVSADIRGVGARASFSSRT